MEVFFHIADYVLMGAFLLVSLGIGAYYGLVQKQNTTEEYLFGNRQMSLLPVALSMLVTYQSAISVVGLPAEIYMYNTMLLWANIGISIANMVQYFMIVPLMYPLRLTSAYEYLGLRFKSRTAQLMGTFIGMLQTLLYMSIVLLAPAIALEAVAGIPLWISVVVVGIIGTVYTSLGGIKSVIWTDVFQFIILYAGLMVILILSVIKIGSFEKIWQYSVSGKRIVFDSISADPRVRHTVWSCVIGGAFNWIPNCCNQSAVQRICAMKNVKQSKLAVLLNIPLGIIFGIILTLIALVMYAFFAYEECDPLQAGAINNANQAFPYFVMRILSHLPGLPGLFIAALFSGSLSSLSSGINSMAANTVEDVLVNYLKNTSQWAQTLVAKLIVIVYGALAVTLAYLAKDLPGPVTQIASFAMGSVGGPVAGMIFLGGLFPQANKMGAIGGGLICIGVNAWVAICSVIYGAKAPTSPSLGIERCEGFLNTTSTSTYISNTTSWPPSTAIFNQTSSTPSTLDTPDHLALYDISYFYFALIGFMSTIIFGLVISIVTGMNKEVPDPKYIFPCMRGFWRAGCRGVQVATPSQQKYTFESNVIQSTATEKKGSKVLPVETIQSLLYKNLPRADSLNKSD